MAGGGTASRQGLFRPRGKGREPRLRASLRLALSPPSILRCGAAHRLSEMPAIHGVGEEAWQGRPVRAGPRFAGRRLPPLPLGNAIDPEAAGRQAEAPAHRFADTTRPKLSGASRRGRSLRPRSRAASVRRAGAWSATRPSRGGEGGGTRRRRCGRGRRRAPRLRLRPVPRARRRCAPPAGTRPWRASQAACGHRVQGLACSSRPGCTRAPSPARGAH